jgi:hypothetical protein
MKYIFTIHSHITFLAAVGTILHENLATEDVIVISSGRYSPKFNNFFKGKVIKDYDSIEGSYSFLGKLKSWNYTKSVNQYISKFIQNQDFIAYIDLMSVFNRYLIMHPKCEQFHIIEEGIVNYADYDDFMLWTADLRQFNWQWNGVADFKQMLNAITRLLRGRSIRLLAMPIHPNLYTLHRKVKAFCFSEYAFQYTPLDQREILDWNVLEKYVAISNDTYEEGSWFWIGDTICSSYDISMTHFESAIQQLMNKINPEKTERVLYLKFRGGESQQEKELTLKYLNDYNFKVEIVDASTIMELTFIKNNNLTVCGIASSLLIYAHLMGHTTHSLYPYIPDDYGVSLSNCYNSISKKVGFI